MSFDIKWQYNQLKIIQIKYSTDKILKRFLGRKDEHISAQLQFTSLFTLLDLDIVECTAEVDSFLKEWCVIWR